MARPIDCKQSRSANMRPMMLSAVLMINACSSQARTLTYHDKLLIAKRGFSAYDLNRDGTISRQEWSVLAVRSASSIPKVNRPQYVRDIDRQFLRLDKNGDGKITLEEYIADDFGQRAS